MYRRINVLGFGISGSIFHCSSVKSRESHIASDALWRSTVLVVHSNELDLNTPQTSGMTRAAAITHAKAGAGKLWAGTMVGQPAAKDRITMENWRPCLT
jgi:hypothetical protein